MKKMFSVLLTFLLVFVAGSFLAIEGYDEAIAPMFEQITTELTPQQRADLVTAVVLHMAVNGETGEVQAAMDAIVSSLHGSSSNDQTTETASEATGTAPSQGESNALRSAEQYLSVMAFSHTGLVAQLEYEGYSNAEAVYAADNCGADWNVQAAKSAAQYLDLMAFSRDGLIDQLVYEGYTREQAEYGAKQNGY